jgi:hypothetical protein
MKSHMDLMIWVGENTFSLFNNYFEICTQYIENHDYEIFCCSLLAFSMITEIIDFYMSYDRSNIKYFIYI